MVNWATASCAVRRRAGCHSSSSFGGRDSLGGYEGSHVVPEPFELVQFVGYGPDEDALHTCVRERCQLLGEQLRRSDGKSLPKRVLGPVHGRYDPFPEDAVGFTAV